MYRWPVSYDMLVDVFVKLLENSLMAVILTLPLLCVSLNMSPPLKQVIGLTS